MAFVGDHTFNSLETGTEFVINQVINNFTFVYYFLLIAKRKITCDNYNSFWKIGREKVLGTIANGRMYKSKHFCIQQLYYISCRGRYGIEDGFTSTFVPCEVYSIQLYVIMFPSDLPEVGVFLQILRFPPPVLKVALNTHDKYILNLPTSTTTHTTSAYHP